MSEILVIGMGNPLRSDDGVGWRLAMEFSHEKVRADVHIIATQQLMPENVDPVSRAKKVLFVDAAEKGRPGNVQVQRIAPAQESRFDSHQMTPAMVLKLAIDLYDRQPQAFLLTVVGESFSPGETFSEAVSGALPAVRKTIERFLSWAQNDENMEPEFLDGAVD
jgi:hydrogenase maturation protease